MLAASPLSLRLLAAALLALGSALQAEDKVEHRFKLDLDPLLDPAKLWDFTPKTLDASFTAEGFKENPCLRWVKKDEAATLTERPFSNVSVELSALGGALRFTEVHTIFENGSPQRYVYFASKVEEATLAKLRERLRTVFGSDSQPATPPALGWKVDARLRSEQWQSATAGTAALDVGGGFLHLHWEHPGGGVSDLHRRFIPHPESEERPELAFFVRVDRLMPVPGLWTTDTEKLEQRVMIPGFSLKNNPFFKWTTENKEAARFARNLYSNTSADLLAFDDAVNAEEVNVEFKNGVATKLIYTLLTRGNSGPNISAEKFDSVFKAAGRALGTQLGVRPTRTTVAGKAISKTEGWLWTTPHTLALLEFNVEAPKGQVEFLRLTLTPASARAQLLNLAGIGDNATTKSRSSLTNAVKRTAATGDVEITGVPMRDQGQKGYCVAASCERLLRYMGVPCDMDELAALVRADAERGASPAVMYSALGKIDQRYNMHMKLLKLEPGYTLGKTVRQNEVDRAHRADFFKLVQENVNQGTPLLWSVLLAPGETGVSPGGTPPQRPRPGPRDENRVGHMRLITGYNPKTNGIIYTDSWGAGHERKVMTLNEAASMTTAVFSMSPSR